jgi:hypothetical protein
MSEGSGIPMWARVGGGIVVLLFILSFLAPELPLLIIFYVVPFLAVSFGIGLIWKSFAINEHSEFLDYKALSICFLVGGVLSYLLLMIANHREFDSHGHVILSSFGQFLQGSYNLCYKVTYNIANFKLSNYLFKDLQVPNQEYYDGVTMAALLSTALSIGAPAVALVSISFSSTGFRPKGQLLPASDQHGVDLDAYHTMKEENSNYKIQVRNLRSRSKRQESLPKLERSMSLQMRTRSFGI